MSPRGPAPTPTSRRAGGPTWIASAVLLALATAGGLAALRATAGHLVLPLDDAYIHLTAARTLAEHGTWGIEPGRFASVSSSPLWVLLLAAAGRLASSWRPALPLVLNAAAVVLLMYVLGRLLAPVVGPRRTRILALSAIGVLAAVPAVAFSGTEHVLHGAAFVALLHFGLRAIAEEEAGDRPPARWLALLTATAVALRCETLFGTAGLCALALLRRSPRSAAAVAGGSAAPVLIHALLAVPRGGSWLPNPILLKGRAPDLASWPAAFDTLTRVPRVLARPEAWHLTALLAALVLLALAPAGRSSLEPDRERLHRRLCTVVAVAVVLHVQLAALGSFYRYEAYLLVAGLAAIVVRLPALAGTAAASRGSAALRGAAAAALVALAALTALRAGNALTNMPTASANIWEQQMQMARFVRWRDTPEAVAVNDLGAVSYLGNAAVVDIVGLADDEVAAILRRGRTGPGVLARLLQARGVGLLVAYEEWLHRWGGPPTGWVPVERWEIRDNLVCAGPVVTFFAPEAGAAALRRQLEAFAPRLPPGVARHPESTTAGPRGTGRRR